jgi:hypothetical protein
MNNQLCWKLSFLNKKYTAKENCSIVCLPTKMYVQYKKKGMYISFSL